MRCLLALADLHLQQHMVKCLRSKRQIRPCVEQDAFGSFADGGISDLRSDGSGHLLQFSTVKKVVILSTPSFKPKRSPRDTAWGLTVIRPHRLLSTTKVVYFRLQIVDMLHELCDLPFLRPACCSHSRSQSMRQRFAVLRETQAARSNAPMRTYRVRVLL